MLQLKEVIDEKTLIIIQRMLTQFLQSSAVLYELDGSNAYGVFEDKICHEDCRRISMVAMDRREPVEKECCGGIKIYAVPICYNEQTIGCISASMVKGMTSEEKEGAGMQLRMAALLISSLYESKIKQLEAENEVKRKNKELEAVIQNVSNGVFLYSNNDQTVTFLNEEAREFFYNAHEYKCPGDSFTHTQYFDQKGKIIPFDQLPHKITMNGEKVTDLFVTAVRPDKTMHVSLNGCPIFDEDGNVTSSLFCVHDITELVNDKREIIEQKDKLEAIINNMSDGLSIFDSDGKYILFNNAAKEMFFPSFSHIAKAGDGLNQAEYFDLEGHPIPFESFPANRVKRGEQFVGMRMNVKFPCKSIYISVSGTPICDADNNVTAGILCSRDISEIVEYEAKLKQQKELLETIIDNVSDLLIVYRQDGNMFLANKEAKKFLQEHENKILLQDLSDCNIHTVYSADKLQHFRTAANPVYDEDGDIEYIVISMFDVTEIIEREKLVKEQKEQLEAIIQSIDDAIFIFDVEKNYYLTNRSAQEYFPGIVLNRFGDTFGTYKYYDQSGNEIPLENKILTKVLQGDAYSNLKITLRNRNTTKHVSINGRPIYDSEGNIQFAIFSSRDVTRDIQAQRKIERQKDELENAMKMKDEFLSLVSHEFKTPLTVINSAIQAMELICRKELSEKAKGFLSKIRQNSFRQLRLVNNILDITRVNAGKVNINKKNLDIVFLTKAITESVCLYASQKGIKLTFKASTSHKVIGIDEEKYERILLNLLSNAIKFTSSGKAVHVSLYTRKGFVHIAVKDSGVGIPKDKQELIFERFGQVDNSLTRQAEGTGIGLSLVRLFVISLGGSISIKSVLGKGSTFTVMLPMEKVKEEADRKTYNVLPDNWLVQTTTIEFSDIYL